MSKQDIRSFFSAKPKAKAAEPPKKRTIISSDDDESENKANNSKKEPSVKRETKKRRIIDSEDEEEPAAAQAKAATKKKPNLGKLKDEPKRVEADLASAFGKSPVKRVEKKSQMAVVSIPSDDEFEKSIINMDEEPKSPRKSPRKQAQSPVKQKSTESKSKKRETTPEPKKSPRKPQTESRKREASPEPKKSPRKPQTESRKREASPEPKKSPKKSLTESKSRKREASSEPKKSPKKSPPEMKKPESKSKRRDPTPELIKSPKKSPQESKPKATPDRKAPSSAKTSAKKVTSPVDLESSVQLDEDRHERKQMAAALYQKFKNRASVINHGCKEIPKGKPNCLAGKIFLVTGVLESMERGEAEELIKEYGGKVSSGVTKKLNYMVAGEDAGPSKLVKAQENGVKIMSEDDLLDMIRGGPAPARKEEIVKSPKKEKASPKGTKKEVKIKEEKTEEKEEEFQSFKVTKRIKSEPMECSSSTSKSPETAIRPTCDEKNLAWVDKYKPTSVKHIIGQSGPSSNTNKLMTWLQNWHSNHDGKKKLTKPSPWAKNDDGAYFKAALLSGPPGIGKTTTATLVCKELGYDTVEFNASDTRNKRLLKEQVSEILKNKSLFGYVTGHEKRASAKHVLLMDEVDGMAGNEDRGGIAELILLIKESSIPIICMCNDRNHQKMRSLVNYCFDLRFQRPRVEQIKGAMMSLCFKEKMKVDPKSIEEIITASNNDIRQTINYLAMLSVGKDLPQTEQGNEKGNVMKKDLKVGPWEVVRKVFMAEEHKKMSIHDKADLFFQDYSMGPLFVQENYLQVLPSGPKDEIMAKVAKAASSLSRGDLIERRIRSNNNWSVLPVQAMFSSVIPGEFMSGNITGQINFPGWLGKNSKRTKRSRMAQEIHDHTRVATSGSRTSVRMDYAPFILEAIVRPLREDGAEGVPKALEVMREYRISREDIDSLIELSAWPGKKNPMDAVESKVKAALTRAYNKEALAFVPAAKKSAKGGGSGQGEEEGLEEYEEDGGSGEEDEEQEDNMDNDAMIKQKKKPAASLAADAKGKAKAKPKEKKEAPAKKAPAKKK